MCQVYINPQHVHPIFSDGSGTGKTSLQLQAGVLFCALAGLSQVQTHMLLGGNRKMIGSVYQNLDAARAADVIAQEKNIVLGGGNMWQDIEADEATFRKETLRGDALSEAQGEEGCKPDKNTKWEQWAGIVSRGMPQTLILSRLPAPLTTKRSPGPGATRKVDWAPLAEKHLQGTQVIFHTDSAKSYLMKIKGVVHDRVVHKKTKAEIRGKTVWVQPKYVEMKTHKLPGGKTLKVKTGTQVIDRAWRFIKDRLKNCSAMPGSRTLAVKIRSAQWSYWHRDDDQWTAAGEMLQRAFVH